MKILMLLSILTCLLPGCSSDVPEQGAVEKQQLQVKQEPEQEPLTHCVRCGTVREKGEWYSKWVETKVGWRYVQGECICVKVPGFYCPSCWEVEFGPYRNLRIKSSPSADGFGVQ